jgi:predicted NodU family carbamoyl transferase
LPCDLLRAFVPVLLNTSFDVVGKPIVLVVEDYVIEK